VAVRLLFQISMKREDIVHQAMLELLHITLSTLSAHELFPRREEILHRDDILVGMSELPSRMTPPQPSFAARFGAHQDCVSSLA
jgi:hypothetical protein